MATLGQSALRLTERRTKHDVDRIAFLAHHILLPPKLPQSLDADGGYGDKQLTQFILEASEPFVRHCLEAKIDTSRMLEFLDRVQRIHEVDRLDLGALVDAVQTLKHKDSFLLYLGAQNCAMIIRREADHMVIEVFEASPTNADIMSNPGSLQRVFPGTAISISRSKLVEKEFLLRLAKYLSSLAQEVIPEFQPSAQKAGFSSTETRDTTAPTAVVDMLISLLLPLGRSAPVAETVKRTREDVCWDSCLIPWRRSPFWLALRVGIQRSLQSFHGQDDGHMLYKNFMAFVTCRLCDKIGESDLNLASFARAKLARRADKLAQKGKLLGTLQNSLRSALENVRSLLEKDWANIRQSCVRKVLPIPKASPNDLHLRLRNSKTALSDILHDTSNNHESVTFHFKSSSRLNFKGLLFTDFKPKFSSDGLELVLELSDFEAWVKTESYKWDLQAKPSVELCQAVSNVFASYLKSADKIYKYNIDHQSIMLLTLLELWAYLDRMAVELVPLLKTYHPEIPSTFFRLLRIATIDDMKRVSTIERYIAERTATASGPQRSVFTHARKDSFSTEYFDEYGADMQSLQTDIERGNQQEKEAKRDEWTQLRSRYHDLLDQAKNLNHEEMLDSDGDLVHDMRPGRCRRCSLEQQASHLSISPIEEHLPRNEYQRKAVLFELRCPEPVQVWREVTWRIVTDLGREQGIAAGVPNLQPLNHYEALRGRSRTAGARLTLGSSEKSYLVAHYGSRQPPTDDFSQLCKPHALRWGLYDRLKDCWVDDQKLTPELLSKCPGLIPRDSLYKSLNFSITGTSHVSNAIVANKCNCPQGTSLSEFNNFQQVRSGEKLQWPNMLIELAGPHLNHTHPATGLLFTQAALQLGSSRQNDPLRQSHWVFRDSLFCQQLLKALRERFVAIKANWQEVSCLRTLLVLLLRLWSLDGSEERRGDMSGLLLDIRSTALKWTRQLSQELSERKADDEQSRLSQKLLSAALLCRSTYDVNNLEEGTVGNTSAFLECGFVIGNRAPIDYGKASLETAHEMIHDWKISHTMDRVARMSMIENPEGINVAIRQHWPEKVDFGTWKPLGLSNEPWFRTIATPLHGGKPMMVHVNILNGHLLVNGQRLGRLPGKYLESSLYQRVFGVHRFAVFPSGVAGMTHTASKQLHGRLLHFGWRATGLVIRAEFDGRLHELLRPDIFGTITDCDLPWSMIQDKAHWLELRGPEEGLVHILPFDSLWKMSGRYWKIHVPDGTAQMEACHLLDPSSSCALAISKAIGDFEAPRYTLVSQSQSGCVTVSLPRLNLNFKLTDGGRLSCEELNATITETQDARTFYGLVTSIVLEDNLDQSLVVVVPKGSVKASRSGSHVSVSIDTHGKKEVQCARFKLNDVLGRLEYTGDAHDLLLQAYLHALTSHVLEDPLTGRSGTEESLERIQEFQRQQYRPLEPNTFELLSAIAALTPMREFYPEHKKVMQKVRWSTELRVAAQHDDFRLATVNLVRQSDKLGKFGDRRKIENDKVKFPGHELLYERARNRNYPYRRVTAHSNSLPCDSILDKRYHARDRISSDNRCARAYEIATLIQAWDDRVSTTRSLGSLLQARGIVDGFHQPFKVEGINQVLVLELNSVWGSLHQKCLNCNKARDWAELTFLFGTLAFSDEANVPLLKPLLAIAFNDRLKAIHPPQWKCYREFQHWQRPVTSLIEMYLRRYDRSPVVSINPNEITDLSRQEQAQRRANLQRAHDHALTSLVKQVSSKLLSQWPCQQPTDPLTSIDRIDVANAIPAMQSEWNQWYRNWQLSIFIDKLQDQCGSLKSQPFRKLPKMDEFGKLGIYPRGSNRDTPCLKSLMLKMYTPSGSKEELQRGLFGKTTYNQAVGWSHVHGQVTSSVLDLHQESILQELEQLIRGFEKQACKTRAEFGGDLRLSLDALRLKMIEKPIKNIKFSEFNLRDLQFKLKQEMTQVAEISQGIRRSLEHHDRFQWLSLGGLWPVPTTVSVIECLQASTFENMSSSFRKVLLQYAQCITEVQRYRRLIASFNSQNIVVFRAEIDQEQAHSFWDVNDHPEWLLLEIELNLLLRNDQIGIARRMIEPDAGSNSVYQLQMGKGKSSFIIPAVACALGNRRQLVRVIVTKPLLAQMAGILGKSICRLIGRPILHLPYNRKTTSACETTKLFRKLHETAFAEGGIALCLPEHLLSFRLNGQQCVIDGKIKEANVMLDTQAWFDNSCRDVMDESDHTLATRTQLIYPSGTQTSVDGGQQRWQTTQALLKIVDGCLPKVLWQHPQAIEAVHLRSHSFPIVHILREEAEETLVYEIVQQICGPDSSFFPMSRLDFDCVRLLRTYLLGAPMSKEVFREIETALVETVDINTFLILRGLVGGGILMLALKKRWNVNYGLHLERCLVAVPYQAKGKPSAAAEFGHPDVAIVLTCLAYYYTGLTEVQLRKALLGICLQQDPSLAWDEWIRNRSDFPSELKSWTSINLEDGDQIRHLLCLLSHSVPTIEYYLNNVVFPREAKEFETKMVSSSWDLVQKARQLTTGFSGTNGNSCHMPLSIQHRSVPEEDHANAEVLYHLLQNRNRMYIRATDDNGSRLSVEGLIALIVNQEPPINVILDAGAQILEMGNSEVARLWLQNRHDATAVVFFGVGDVMQVLYADGRKEKLASSPYSSNLGDALLYLDEEHCRGTDSKLRVDARAALTLGLRQTKDHLVQAAMRMRQLSDQQSVVLFATPEVHQAIVDHNEIVEEDQIDSSHVLSWSMEQTCVETDLYHSLFMSQGRSFIRRDLEMSRMSTATDDQKKAIIAKIKEKEKHPLTELYGPQEEIQSREMSDLASPMLQKLNALARQSDQPRRLRQATANEEQERELEVEVEEERQVQRPPSASALTHDVHPDIKTFIEYGHLTSKSLGYRRAFEGLRSTSMGHFLDHDIIDIIQPNLFASIDFERTVELAASEQQDQYLRPVRWVLMSNVSADVLIISPFEANELLFIIQDSTCVHLATYDAPKTRQMVSRFGALGFYSTPPLPDQWKAPDTLLFALGLFSGRLFFPWREYEALCSWLSGLSRAETRQRKDEKTSAVDNVPGNVREFVHELTSTRNDGAGFLHSPMGYICRDRPLTKDHPGFADDSTTGS